MSSARRNLIVINGRGRIYDCDSCGTSSNSKKAVLSHARSEKQRGEWCERCQWLFIDGGALEQHLHNSGEHIVDHQRYDANRLVELSDAVERLNTAHESQGVSNEIFINAELNVIDFRYVQKPLAVYMIGKW